VLVYTRAHLVQNYEMKASNDTSSFYFSSSLRITVYFLGYLEMVSRRTELFCCATLPLTKHGFAGFVRQEIVLDCQCLTDLK
jgi:hypothetical protein